MFNQFRSPDLAALVLRLGLAAIFLFHGGLKVAYGSTDWNPLLPTAVQVAVAWGEVLCGAACLLGLCSRLSALGMIAIMAGAIILVTGQRDFTQIDYTVMPIQEVRNPDAGFTRLAPGYEYNVAIIAMCVALIALGSGPYSLDRFLWRRKEVATGSVGRGASDAPAPGVHTPTHVY
jgi:uncharacterized membrane protein YphA (DoxX/SURF4 family)